MEIIVKSYGHINKAFPNWDCAQGKIVKNKDHYDRLMKENNMITHEEMQRRAEGKKLKEYKISEQSLAIIKAAKMSADKKGNVKLGGRAIKALIDRKAIKPKEYAQGFNL